MAHGTGYFLNRVYNADMNKEEYAVIVLKEVYYFFPQMSDSYEPDSEETGKFEIVVMKWRKDRFGRKVADDNSETARTGLVDRSEARMVYKSLRDRQISFDRVAKHFRNIR